MRAAAKWRGHERRVAVVPPMQSFPRARARVDWWRVFALTIALLLCAAAWIGVLAPWAEPHLRGPL